MRAFRSALSGACFFAGLVLVLRLLGLLGVILHGIAHWWPALPGIAGAAILARSFRSGPHVVVAGGLMLASGIAFAATHGFITEHTWTFAGAGGLVIAGIMLAWSSVKVRSTSADSRSAVKMVLFRTETFAPSSAELEHLKVFLLCGNIELDLRGVITPGAPRNILMIDITACAGRIKIVVLPDVYFIDHKAFAMRLTKQLEAGFPDEGKMMNADVMAATLAFFGNVYFVVMTTDGRLILRSSAAGTVPGPGNPSPTTQ